MTQARVHALRPGVTWRYIRRACQLVALVAIVVAPVLGGWQRLDRSRMASWDGHGWDLPAAIMDRLPVGEPSKRAYELNRMLGGGSSVDYLGVPIVDPVAGTLALAGASTLPSVLVVIAWLIPIALGLLLGRVFCGWFCPFGTLARLLDLVLIRVAPSWPRARLPMPERRWVRFVLLVAALLAGALGAQLLLYLLLPHALVQQSVYGLWLMGGGGAAFGALLGLLAVGLVFGPTAYCAVACPTGAALALLGRARRVHLEVIDPARCAKACDMCDRACWIDLQPSTNPGPDCDLCGRCTEVCPHANLGVVVGRPAARLFRALPLVLVGLLVACQDQIWRERPALLLDTRHTLDDVDVVVAVVDEHGVRPDPDARERLVGCNVAVFVARGARGEADEFGRLSVREVYLGPLEVRVVSRDGTELDRFALAQPNAPVSVGWRTIYQHRVIDRLAPGDAIEVLPIAGWTRASVWAEIPAPNHRREPLRVLGFVLAGFACFGGVVALAVGMGRSGG